jgi:hypothetical protein
MAQLLAPESASQPNVLATRGNHAKDIIAAFLVCPAHPGAY